MGDIVLSEHEQLCRTAHQQVAMLRHLYDHLLIEENAGSEVPGFSASDRLRELQHADEILSARLNALDLLPVKHDCDAALEESIERTREACKRLESAISAAS